VAVVESTFMLTNTSELKTEEDVFFCSVKLVTAYQNKNWQLAAEEVVRLTKYAANKLKRRWSTKNKTIKKHGEMPDYYIGAIANIDYLLKDAKTKTKSNILFSTDGTSICDYRILCHILEFLAKALRHPKKKKE